MDRELHVRVQEHHPIAVMELRGFCAQLEVYKLKSEAEWQIGDGKRFLVFDLRELNFIDSAGIGVIMQIAERCRTLSGQLAFVCPGESNARRLIGSALSIYKNELYESVPEAVTTLRKKYGLGPVPGDNTATDAAQRSSDDLSELRTRLETMERRLKRLESIFLPDGIPAD